MAASFGYGRTHVAPWLSRFSRLHPALRLQLDLRETPWPDKHDSDAVVHVGAVRDSSWVAHTLASNERWLCASPGYLREHGTPRNPADLAYHACICIRENDEDVTLWHYRKRTKRHAPATKRESLRIIPTLTTNDGDVARQWCERGLGLVLRSEWDAAPAIARGALVRLLPQWDFGSAPAIALVPARSGMTARVRALVEHLQSNLRGRSMQ